MAELLGRWISPRRAYALVRWRNVLLMILIFQLCRRAPGLMRSRFRHMAAAELPPDFDLDTHLSPTYNPWDQRVCMAADGDFFAALREGSASIVTAAIDRFTPGGVRLADGTELAADIIVTATGLRMMMLGGLELEVDGTPVELGSTIAYKGMMLGGVPEPRLHRRLHQRLLDAEGRPGGRVRVPAARPHAGHREADLRPAEPPRGPARPTRSSTSSPATCCGPSTRCPKQSSALPWRLHQNYIRDIRMLRHGPVDDEIDFRLPAPAAERPALATVG